MPTRNCFTAHSVAETVTGMRLIRITILSVLILAGLSYSAYQIFRPTKKPDPQIVRYLIENRLKPSEFCRQTSPNTLEGGGYVWELLTKSAAYAPRDGANGVVHNGKMVMLGGWNPDDKVHFPRITNNEVWESTDGRQWSLIKTNSFLDNSFDAKKDWEGRHSAGVVSYKGEIWLIGGDATQFHHQHDIWKSKDGRDWQLVNDGASVPWKPRALHMTFVLNDRIYVVGGQSMSKKATLEPSVGEHYYNDVWSTTDGRSWVKHEPVGPIWTPRGGIGGQLLFRGRVWIVGGFVNENHIVKNRVVHTDIWSSPDADHWTKEADGAEWSQDGGLAYHDMGVFADRLWIIGGAKLVKGNDDPNVSRVWSSADGKQWSELKCAPIPPTHATTVFSLPDRLVIAAGNHLTREVWELRRKR
ncbi:MAG: hypothetical protein WAT18_03855 [Sphingorhabdus sp.]|uniref:hypothetical protein n=2 Tax=Sphingorhabdus sp. TaxID=1902408 RepID=UPI003BB01275|nr:hypothetical protein [Sphingomonadales bacterium]